MSESTSSSQVIPPPPEFPVQWEDAEDAQLFWAQVQGYYPTPITPMGFALIHEPTVEVGNQSLAELNVPLKQVTRHINGYVYSALIVPTLEEQPEPSQEQLNEMVAGLASRWHSTALPEIKKHLAWWHDFDLQSAELPALVKHLEESQPRMDRLEKIHLDVVTELLIAIDLFQKMVADLFPDESKEQEGKASVDSINAHALLAGFEAKGAQSSLALWNLSRQVLNMPEVKQTFSTTVADQVLARLADTEAGRGFLKELDNFLQTYGYQGNKSYVSRPTLGEDPTLAIQSIQGYLAQPDRDLEAETATIVAKREAGIAIVREKLSSYPQPLVAQFEFLLKAAQEATWLREEHAHQLDLPLNQCVRQVLLALGQRLNESNILAHVNDIFYLTPDEVSSTIASEPAIPLQELVHQRRAMEEKYAAIAPPPMFGTLPTEMPPPHPITNAIMQNLGDPSQASITPDALTGIPASSGQVQGRARILCSETEADRLNSGDILVAATTVPSWTPLFANIAGLVTATGGPLSHAAVVAREFGIPAVVGAVGATSSIEDGQWIEVDGTTGVVRLDLETTSI